MPGNRADDDCDGRIDEDVAALCMRDADRDGFGNGAVTAPAPAGMACPPGWVPAGETAVATDCDDGDPDVFPGQPAYFATSRCEGGVSVEGPCWDYDCDGAEELRWPRAAACTRILGRTCAGEGWDLVSGLLPPACGGRGAWTACTDVGILGCLPGLVSTGRTQECH